LTKSTSLAVDGLLTHYC